LLIGIVTIVVLCGPKVFSPNAASTTDKTDVSP
jgi:hypothetical protein